MALFSTSWCSRNVTDSRPCVSFAGCCAPQGARHPRVIVTDKLRSYAAAKRVVMPGVGIVKLSRVNERVSAGHIMVLEQHAPQALREGSGAGDLFHTRDRLLRSTR
jgi:hypothetical protein